jgi:hypothetical protein
MIRSVYSNQADDSKVTGQVATDRDLVSLLTAAGQLRGGRGIPAVELTRPGGSSLTIEQD